MSEQGRRREIDDERVREALTSAVARWRYDARERSSLVATLASPHLRTVVDREVGALLADAGARVRAGRWEPDDVARIARRTTWVDASVDGFVTCALRSIAPHRLAPAPPQRTADLMAAITALVFLADLPALPELSAPRPAIDDPEQARMLEKVRALLAKAESTTFEEEAEAFTAKAQELMARYAIDAAIVDAGASDLPEAGGIRIGIDEPYATPKAVLLGRIAIANRCRSVWSDGLGLATVFGSHGDLRAVEVLYTSLLVQAVTAMQRAGSQVDVAGRSRTRSFRHAFLLAFADRIGERLEEAGRAAERAATEEVGGSFLPVLASRAEAAERARDAAFPRRSKMRTSLSNVAGYRAGRAAADTASLDRGAPLRK